MSSWRRAVQLGARFIRSTTKTNKGLAAVTGVQFFASLETVEALLLHLLQYPSAIP